MPTSPSCLDKINSIIQETNRIISSSDNPASINETIRNNNSRLHTLRGELFTQQGHANLLDANRPQYRKIVSEATNRAQVDTCVRFDEYRKALNSLAAKADTLSGLAKQEAEILDRHHFHSRNTASYKGMSDTAKADLGLISVKRNIALAKYAHHKRDVVFLGNVFSIRTGFTGNTNTAVAAEATTKATAPQTTHAATASLKSQPAPTNPNNPRPQTKPAGGFFSSMLAACKRAANFAIQAASTGIKNWQCSKLENIDIYTKMDRSTEPFKYEGPTARRNAPSALTAHPKIARHIAQADRLTNLANIKSDGDNKHRAGLKMS